MDAFGSKNWTEFPGLPPGQYLEWLEHSCGEEYELVCEPFGEEFRAFWSLVESRMSEGQLESVMMLAVACRLQQLSEAPADAMSEDDRGALASMAVLLNGMAWGRRVAHRRRFAGG